MSEEILIEMTAIMKAVIERQRREFALSLQEKNPSRQNILNALAESEEAESPFAASFFMLARLEGGAWEKGYKTAKEEVK